MTLKAVEPEAPQSPIEELLDIMARLRNPVGGCPWDLEQSFASIAPYTIEEAYEVADAITRDDMKSLREELGDLLLQVVFHSQMAREAGLFCFNDVVKSINRKMIERHPHVFGEAEVKTAAAQTDNWEKLKVKERAEKGDARVLDGVALGLPALMRSQKLQTRAARVGFDWPDIEPVYGKITEELAELREASATDNHHHIEEEFGDLLFSMTNLARRLNIDSETALRNANAKFERRFNYIEDQLKAQGKSTQTSTLDEMDALWEQAKAEERKI